mmetsp:Transcript_5141/g.14400  ORF Transcript_5141/g.14400 Transcript_5141/m.14400 type:complete len:202 (+) Transcript_5141:931-1536(+)
MGLILNGHHIEWQFPGGLTHARSLQIAVSVLETRPCPLAQDATPPCWTMSYPNQMNPECRMTRPDLCPRGLPRETGANGGRNRRNGCFPCASPLSTRERNLSLLLSSTTRRYGRAFLSRCWLGAHALCAKQARDLQSLMAGGSSRLAWVPFVVWRPQWQGFQTSGQFRTGAEDRGHVLPLRSGGARSCRMSSLAVRNRLSI